MKNYALAFLAASFLVGCVAPVKPGDSINRNILSVSQKNASPLANPNQDIVVQKVDKDDIRDIIRQEKMVAPDIIETDMVFSAVGEGIAPLNTVSPAQALILAKRAAMADAYGQLAGKLYGVKINGKDTVKDAMLGSSTVTSQVQGLVKNASIVNESFNQGLYRVSIELKINSDKWKELFAY